jgi:urease accessory protein UreH
MNRIYELQNNLESIAKEPLDFMLTRTAFKEWLESRNMRNLLKITILQDKTLCEMTQLELEHKALTTTSTVTGELYTRFVYWGSRNSKQLNKIIKKLQKEYTEHRQRIYVESCQNN